MEAPKIRILPRHLLMEITAEPLVIPILENHFAAMHPLPTWAAPGFDGVEIIEFRHTAARRGQMPLCPSLGNIDPADIEDISEEAPILIKLTRLKTNSHPGQSSGIVDLVTVEPEDPGAGSGIPLDQVMANGGCSHAMDLQFSGKLPPLKIAEDFQRAVGGGSLHGYHLIAEINRVSKDSLDI
jgi:hypothetical protein